MEQPWCLAVLMNKNERLPLQGQLSAPGHWVSQAVRTPTFKTRWGQLVPSSQGQACPLPRPACRVRVAESTKQMLSFVIYSSLENILEAQGGKVVLEDP